MSDVPWEEASPSDPVVVAVRRRVPPESAVSVESIVGHMRYLEAADLAAGYLKRKRSASEELRFVLEVVENLGVDLRRPLPHGIDGSAPWSV